MSEKKSFLVRSQILGLLVNTLTANYEYSRKKKKKKKKKKNEPHGLSISEVIDSKQRAYLNA